MTTIEVMATPEDCPPFRVRIVNVDYYSSEPNVRFDDIYSQFRQSVIKKVPVLRVFGTTHTGLKTCLHIHRVYPYLCIKLDPEVNDNLQYNKHQFMRQLVNDLESRLMPSRVTRNTTKDSPNDQLIYDVREVEAIPFYGFHDNYHKFLRIYFYNPSTIQKASDVLLSGEIMGRKIQPYEAHIPYVLQFFIDHNLYGMNFLDAKNVYYRKTDFLDSGVECTDITPMSSCQIECDIDFEDILNRHQILDNRRLPGLEAIWAEELNKCKDSQEMMHLKGQTSQDRPKHSVTESETYHMERLFEGLAKLNLKLDNENDNSFGSDLNESQFAEMIVQCIEDNNELLSDKINDTIEEVINNSQTLTIVQTIEDVITNSQKQNKVIEVINSKKEIKSKTKTKRGLKSRKRLIYLSSDEESDESTEIEDCLPNAAYVDAGTQTDMNIGTNDSFGFGQELEEVVCDCESDECCDQCCDQGSNQCECDCDKCEYEKCKRIPQLDGAFDSDDSGSNFSPAHKEESEGDSDFEVGSKRKKTPKKGGKKSGPKSRSKTNRRKKSSVSHNSDDSDIDSYKASRSAPKRRGAARQPSPALSEDKDEDVFESSFGRKVKSSKSMSSRLWDQFKPSEDTKKRERDSPIHMSFSESDGSDKESKSVSIKGISLSPKKSPNSKSRRSNDDNRSDRSMTPYLSHSEDELPPKTKPGPKFSKSSLEPKPGPKSSKAPTGRPGPKSSKPKLGPKSSKKRDSISSDPEVEDFSYSSTTRSRRSGSKVVTYDDSVEKITSLYSEVKRSKPPAKGSTKRKSEKAEIQSAIESISEFLTFPETEPYSSTTLFDTSDMRWKSCGGELVQIDANHYDYDLIGTVGEEMLKVSFSPDYILKPYLHRYEEHIEYWNEMRKEVEEEVTYGGKSAKSGTRSKGALKDFYTLPHLNDKKSPVKVSPKKVSGAQKTNTRSVKEIARLMSDASDLLDKALPKTRGQKPVPKAKSHTKSKVRTPVAKKVLPKRTAQSSKAKAKSPTKSSARSPRSRLPRGVTTTTVFTSTSVPFYESDIIEATELTGQRKRSYLKAMCLEFELKLDKLPKHYLKDYLSTDHKISPFLFENIYYNDYKGYLSDEDSHETQDVILTMKAIIDNVVSISQCVNGIVSSIEQQLDPKPMIDDREEDYFDDMVDESNDWEYNNGEEEEEELVVGIAVDENGEPIGVVEENKKSDECEAMAEEEDNEVTETAVTGGDDPLSDNTEDNDMKSNDGNDSHEEDEANDNNDNDIQNKDEEQNHSQNDEQQTDNEDEEPMEDTAQENEQSGQRYDMSGQKYSHSENQYSNQFISCEGNQQNSNSSTGSSANEMFQQNMGMDANGHQFKQQPNFSTDMFNPMTVHQTQGQSYLQNPIQNPLQNPLQNPIVPTMSVQSGHYSHPNVYPTQQNWSNLMSPQLPVHQLPVHQMPVQQMPLNLGDPNIESQPSVQTDCEFDNFSYMSYYGHNPNIPQFDGVFDDDDFHSEGKPFNVKCSSDETIRQLSQGSRTEEMSANVNEKSAADLVAEALLGHRGPEALSSGRQERYGYYINGVIVKILKSLPEQCLQQLGHEMVLMDRHVAITGQSSAHEFTEEDSKAFLKTGLNGRAKLKYLHSLCNKNVKLCLNRLNLNLLKTSFNENICLKRKPHFITASSLLSIQKSFNNKRICFENMSNDCLIENESNASEVTKSKDDSQLKNELEINEIPESPLNEILNYETNDQIYSFYSENTLSPHFSQNSIRSLDEVLSGDQLCPDRQHSTPMTGNKCKTFSQTLNDSTKGLLDFQLSCDSPKTSKSSPNVSQKSDNKNRFKYYRNDSIIEGPTPSDTNQFELSSVSPTDAVNDCDHQYLTTMSVEVHVSTRARLNPDPQTDPIEVIFYSIMCDRPSGAEAQPKYTTGVIAVMSDMVSYECSDSFNMNENRHKSTGISMGDQICVDYTNDEIVLLMKFVEIVKQWDPEIMVGYKIDSLSWGYVLERANVLNMSIMTPLSRINDEKYSRNFESTPHMKCHLSGRIALNLWTIIRREVTLKQYNYENVHYHVLHHRIPCFTYAKLTQMYANASDGYSRRRVIDYYLIRTVGSLRILDKLDFIGKTSEMSRLFGIQFQDVFNRGSQFRVESIMLRNARLFDFMPISPSPRQVSAQKAPESVPLVLEPYSKYYCDPVAVLDFQSLYPSIMIAYNYCYSTCLGRVDELIKESDFFEFGCVEIEVKKQLLYKYRNDINISPNGVVFLKDYVRKGILPKMLEEILETRVMVKNAIKANNRKPFPNKALHRKLDARQLGLKLIANVTYGYTGANFSGRMPCIDIADSIVSKARETLERAINLVDNTPEWGGKVVYGDTDSLFVHFPGVSKEEAFKRGQQIAEKVTEMNPKPVKLKFEKVYLPCVLETKKHYVGFSYETPQQIKPTFDAKGIETVRRDTCPVVAKMLEKSLRILFETNDLNVVKQYLFRQFQKILDGSVSILNDFVFAREYRGADSYSDKSHVPSHEIAKRRLAVDPRSEPKVKERVPYIVTCGEPKDSLFKLIKEPMEMINNPTLRLNSQYYIERAIIPALNRVFQLMGHNVSEWYREMPKKYHYNRYLYLLAQETKAVPRTIPQFFTLSHCVVCETNSKGKDFCDSCRQTPHQSVISVNNQIRELENKYNSVSNACKTCSGCPDGDIQCQSIECPNLYRFHHSKLERMNAKYLSNVLKKYF